MINNKVSVIVPVYNAEKFLDRCLESIINQTYHNLEIIVINDGSSDNSLNICQKYEKNDNRILIIDSVNEGVSAARNKGIKKATGKYLAFVDSDDYIEKNMIESLVKRQRETNADLVVCDFCFEDINGNYDTRNNKTIISMNKDQTIYNVLHPNKIYYGFLWNKLFLNQIFIENNLLFDLDISMREDLLLILDYCKYINYSSYISDNLYHYVNANSKSLSVLKSKDIESIISRIYTQKKVAHRIKTMTNNKRTIRLANSLYILGIYNIINEGYNEQILSEEIADFCYLNSKKEVVFAFFCKEIGMLDRLNGLKGATKFLLRGGKNG